MTSTRWSRVDRLSVVLACGLLAYRFCNLDLVTFINDEPHLLAAAEDEAHGRGWVSASPIAGTQGLHYGPVPTWFFGVVHLIFGSSPLASIVAMGLVVTLGQLVFLGLLTKLLRGGPAIFGALVALAAASPFAFAWSRTAWDNTILVGAFSCAALLLANDELSLRRRLVIGTLFGISVGTHLMVLPVLLILLAVTFFPRRADLKKCATDLASIAAPFAVINLPYLFYLARPHHVIASTTIATIAATSPHVRPPFDLGDALTTIVLTFLAPARILTTAGVSYFFDDAWNDFRSSLGMGALLLHGAWIALILAAFAIAGLVLSIRNAPPSQAKRIALLALFSWLGYAIFLLVDGLDPHPHYQHPVWWTVPTGLALLFVWLRAQSETRARMLIGGVWTLSLIQFLFLPMWMHWVRDNGGTRGIHTTTPLAEEQTWLRSACASEKDFSVSNHTVIFEAALDYVASTDPACANHTVTICEGECEGDPKTPTLDLTYAGTTGGHLAPPNPLHRDH